MKRAAIFSALALAACLTPDLAPRFTPAWEPFDDEDPSWAKSRRVLLIADCQFHNLYSQPIPDRNLSIKAAASTAIRAPQLDLFSPDVLAWILENGTSGADLVLHLGDALDIACEGEWDAFVEVMNGAGTPWFMAPGNHDFFYLGSYDTEDIELWRLGCHGSEHLPKDRFIRLYVENLLARTADASLVALGAALPGGELPLEFEWHAPEDVPGDLRAIAWRINEEHPYRSFLLQKIDLSVSADAEWTSRTVLLDSCQYMRRPVLIPNAWQSFPVPLNCGSTGEMLPDQLRIARRWVAEEKSQPRRTVSLMCHHPFDALAPRTKSSLGWMWREYQIGLLVTAHTHKGYFAHHDLGGERDELELNLGSTTDWPMEWRVVQGFAQLDPPQAYIRAERHTLVETLRNTEGFFEVGWEVPLDAPDDYRRYNQGLAANDLFVSYAVAHHIVPYWLPQPRVRANAAAQETEESVKDTLLWTYYRLVDRFPTDPRAPAPSWPGGTRSDREVRDKIFAITGLSEALDQKIALLKQLAAFERSRSTWDPETKRSTDAERARFKISQAAWASRFEQGKGRRLSVEDDLLRVNRPITDDR